MSPGLTENFFSATGTECGAVQPEVRVCDFAASLGLLRPVARRNVFVKWALWVGRNLFGQRDKRHGFTTT